MANTEFMVKKGEPSLVRPEEETYKGLYFLSNLDQNHQVMLPLIYCFKSEGKGSVKVMEVLKKALSKLLVHYYPVAGRLTVGSDGKLTLECTGEGAVFVEAEASCTIEDILNNGTEISDFLKFRQKLLYDIPGADDSIVNDPPFVAQVTKFKCGGFTVGIRVNHLIFDGVSTMDFMNSWGDIARGFPIKLPPFLDRSIFKARNPPQIEFPHYEYLELEDISNTAHLYQEQMVYRSFCFTPQMLEQLKMKAMKDGVITKCTPTEVLSAFVWRARSRALKLHPNQQTRLLLFVDERSKLNIPKQFFGNALAVANSLCTAEELVQKPLSYVVGMVQDSIKMVSTDRYVKSAIDFLEVTRANPSLNLKILIASWSKLSFYTTDFGWGQPVFAGRAGLPGNQTVTFIPDRPKKSENTKGLKSINVLLGLPISAMNNFQDLVLESSLHFLPNKL